MAKEEERSELADMLKRIVRPEQGESSPLADAVRQIPRPGAPSEIVLPTAYNDLLARVKDAPRLPIGTISLTTPEAIEQLKGYNRQLDVYASDPRVVEARSQLEARKTADRKGIEKLVGNYDIPKEKIQKMEEASGGTCSKMAADLRAAYDVVCMWPLEGREYTLAQIKAGEHLPNRLKQAAGK